MKNAPIVVPCQLVPGEYACPLAPGSVCRPYLGRPDHRVVDECGTSCCSLWIMRHNSPWDAFGRACGYRPDDRPGRDDAPRLTVEASA